MMSKEEMTAEYNQQLKELNEIKVRYNERMAVQNHLNSCIVILAASGYPDMCPDVFAWLKSMADKTNKETESIANEISQVENELAMAAYWISLIN